MLWKFCLALAIYSFSNCVYNVRFFLRKDKFADNTYQNREICRKTYKSYLFSAVFMGIFTIIFLIIGV